MAFPTSPSNGDEYNGYKYISSLDLWEKFLPTDNWAFKEGPVSFNRNYVNNWSVGGGEGDSLDPISNSDGIDVLKDGLYEIRAVQRSNGVDTYINISLNGNRSALEDAAESMWNHDHSSASNKYSESNFIGWLTAGNRITAGPPSSSSVPNLSYSSNGHTGTIKVKRLK